MESMGIVSLEGVSSMNLVNSSNQTGSAEEFQKCMDNAQDGFSTEVVSKATTKTSVANEAKEVEQADAENSVYETTDTAQVQEDGAAEEFLDEVEQKVKDLIKSVMDVEDSELETIMDELGLTYLQLLDPANLQKLVMAVNGTTEVTDFLTNEKMLAQFTELNQCFEEIDWKALTGMSKQELLSFLEAGLNQDTSEEVNFSFDEVLADKKGDLTEQQSKLGAVETEELSGDVVSSAAKGEKSEGEILSSQKVETENVVSEENAVIKTDAENTSSNQEMFQSESGMQHEMMHQSAQETDGQPMAVMNFVENLTQAASTENASVTSHIQQMIDIVHQVVEKIQTSIKGETTTMEMQLNPEKLGKVMLTVSEKGGVMTASFTVQTDEAREALESQLQVLRENLEQKNLKVEAVEVSVSDFEFNQSNQMGSGDQKDLDHGDGKQRKFRFDEDEQDMISQEEEAERVRRSVMRDSGSSIDYTA